MMNLYWHSLSFAHSHGYIYGTGMSAVISAVAQQITMEYAGKPPFEVPLEFANSCNQQIF